MTTVPDEETAAATPAPDAPTLPRPAAPATDSTSVPRTEAWAALIADPGHSPELLALAATQTIGPPALSGGPAAPATPTRPRPRTGWRGWRSSRSPGSGA
nr:hypothetical protein GCM10020092_004220 [Actinoplanes digitatis]